MPAEDILKRLSQGSLTDKQRSPAEQAADMEGQALAIVQEARSKDPIEDTEGSTRSFRSMSDKPIPYTAGGHKSVLMLKHTMARLAHDIYEHSLATKFTPVMVMAMAGFGKTTFNRNLIHELHELDPNYALHYFKNVDILQLDTILEGLPKRQPCILVFDDVSYVLENLKHDDRIRILDRLTRVREVIDPEYKETPCIMLLDYHYSYALPKTFRQSNFKIYLSVTDEERENMLKQVGYWNQELVMDYIRIFISMMRYRRFYVANPNEDFNDGRDFVYYRDKPFRAALVSNYGEMHLTLFHKIDGCEKCAIKTKFDKPDPKFWQQLADKYDFDRVHKMLRIYAFQQTGHKNLLPIKERQVYLHIKDHHAENKLDMLALEKLLREVKRLPRDKRQGYFMDTLAKMEGREIHKVMLGTESVKSSLEAARLLQSKGTQDAVNLPNPEEDAEDEETAALLENGSLIGSDAFEDEDNEDDTDGDFAPEKDDMELEGLGDDDLGGEN